MQRSVAPPRALRLPKLIEADPRAAKLLRGLDENSERLWRESELRVARVRLDAELSAVLQGARSGGHVVRGLEAAEATLAGEERGLAIADRRGGGARGARVSRLVLLANDGAERFYRHVDALLRQHRGRVLAVRLDVDAGALGALLFGPGRVARLLLLERKDAVAAALLAIADHWQGAQWRAAPLP
jgi:hypothetical protein